MANTCFQLLFLILPLFFMFVSLEASRFSSNSSNANPSCIDIDRKALVEFEKGLTDPSCLLSSWVGNDCCTWVDLGCSNQTGNVVSLDLRNRFECIYNSSCLGGEVSSSLLDLEYLNYLDLSMNDFRCIAIPNFMGSLEKLSYLNLSCASFCGMIPPHLGNIEFTDVDRDVAISDTIPYWLRELSPQINWLDLSGRHPRTNKKSLNLGYLKYIPHNQLTKKIPEKIGSLQLLETLDLSCNHLSSPIPPTISSMTSLNSLNLSFNNLSRPIPSANQFLTFNDPSIYEGNPELCGPPLSTKCLMPNDRDVDGNQHAKAHKDEDENENLGFYLGMELGFVVGFWGVCGSLVLKKS
ncbi:hypothetical protein ACSBR2_041662 [Camellia fascicularis]